MREREDEVGRGKQSSAKAIDSQLRVGKYCLHEDLRRRKPETLLASTPRRYWSMEFGDS